MVVAYIQQSGAHDVNFVDVRLRGMVHREKMMPLEENELLVLF